MSEGGIGLVGGGIFKICRFEFEVLCLEMDEIKRTSMVTVVKW